MGKITGHGKLTSETGVYVGEFKEGQYHGQGKLTKANGDILTGSWVAGKMEGKGKFE